MMNFSMIFFLRERQRFLLSVSALFLLFGFLPALTQTPQFNLQPPATVGLGTAEVIVDAIRNRVHVLTVGHDADFDGLFEPAEGDISAGWYVLDGLGDVIDSTLFNSFFNDYPIRVGANLLDELLYLPIHGRVQSWDMNTLSLLEDTVVAERFSAVSWVPGVEWLLLSRRAADFTGPGEVEIFNLQGDLPVARMSAGVNPGMAVSEVDPTRGETRLYVLNEGGFGEGNSSLTRLAFAPDVYGAVNGKQLGGGGSAMLYDEAGGRLFVLVPQARLVRVLDATTYRELDNSPIDLGDISRGRALAVDENYLWVSSWDGGVIQVNLDNGDERAYILPGKGEGIAVQNGRLFVALSYQSDSFDPDSRVLVFDVQTGEPLDTLDVGIHPVSIFANPDDNSLVVIGSGADGERGWWREINAATLENLASGLLPASANTPVRGAFDPPNRTLAVIGADTLFTIDLRTDATELAPLYIGGKEIFNHIADGGGDWLLTNFPGDLIPDPSRLYAVAKETGELTGTLVGGIGIPMIPVRTTPRIEGGLAVCLIPEENYGGPNAPLLFAEYYPDLLNGELGNGANHILHEVVEGEPVTAVTMNGSHEVVKLDLEESLGITERISTGTSGFDGPRETALLSPSPFGYSLLVSSYSGDILYIPGDGDAVITQAELDGKGEGIGVLNEQIFVANAFETGTYDPASTVSIAYVDYLDGVETVQHIVTAVESYPNPTSGQTLVRLRLEASARVELELYDPLGRSLGNRFSGHLEAGERTIPLDLRSLPVGTYFYRIHIGEWGTTKSIEVVR